MIAGLLSEASDKGAKMRKVIVGTIVFAALAMTAGAIFASEAEPGTYPLLGLATLAPLNPSPLIHKDLTAEARSYDASPEPLLAETELAPSNPSPLARLDLLPVPASKPQAARIPQVDLSPASVVANYSPSYLRPDTGFRTVGDRLFDVSVYSLVALNIADYFSTREALRHPGLQEGNPLLKSIVKSPAAFAAVKLGVSAVSYISLKGLYKKNKAMAWAVSLASNFFMSYVVSNNMRLISMVKGR